MTQEPDRSFLDWLGLSGLPDWRVARPLGPLLTVIVALLFVAALLAAFAVLWQTIAHAGAGPGAGPNLGAGALIAALLGAPFVIWATVIRHRTVEFQKEGHITDRIHKAVEMLGAD
ncbi:hypothetical protein, partial [Albidovulum sp.]